MTPPTPGPFCVSERGNVEGPGGISELELYECLHGAGLAEELNRAYAEGFKAGQSAKESAK